MVPLNSSLFNQDSNLPEETTVNHQQACLGGISLTIPFQRLLVREMSIPGQSLHNTKPFARFRKFEIHSPIIFFKESR